MRDRVRALLRLREEIRTLEHELDLLKQDLNAVQHNIAQRMLARIVEAKEEKYERLKNEYNELEQKVRDDVESLLGADALSPKDEIES